MGIVHPTDSVALRKWVLKHTGTLADWRATLAFADGYCSAGTIGVFELEVLGGNGREAFIGWTVAKQYFEHAEPALSDRTKALITVCSESPVNAAPEVIALREIAAEVLKSADTMRTNRGQNDPVWKFWKTASTAEKMVASLMSRAR